MHVPHAIAVFAWPRTSWNRAKQNALSTGVLTRLGGWGIVPKFARSKAIRQSSMSPKSALTLFKEIPSVGDLNRSAYVRFWRHD